MKNYVVVDFEPSNAMNIDEWHKFIIGLNETSSNEWELFGTKIHDMSFHSKERYVHYFKLAWDLFRDRKEIAGIVANQQFYGIIFAFFCRLFHVKKTTKNVVVSFIYNKKSGLKGKIYEYFIKYSVRNGYVDKLIVHSKSEIDYYSMLLGIVKEKFIFCPLGITDDSAGYQISRLPLLQESYVLGVGNSNRDFTFMEDALAGEEYNVHIFSDNAKEHQNQNIQVKKGIPVSEYYEQLAGAFCSVIPIDNPNFSSGQLIMLQSYAFEKPVIITLSNVNDEYVGDGNAIVIHKDKDELLEAIDMLRDEMFYIKQVKKAKEFFNNKFSMYAMGCRLGKIIGDLNNE